MADQLGDVVEDGWTVVSGLVGDDLLAAADAEVDRLLAAAEPLPPGFHFLWRTPAESPTLAAPLAAILPAAAALTGGDGVRLAFDQVQVALNIPPHPHRPGRPHLDGYAPGQDRPGTFTMLAGLLLTDETADDTGNLWVWPGTHRTHAAFFAERGPGAFAEAAGYPDVELPAPTQVRGRRGDVLLAHYLLGHNIGGNRADRTRRALYWRLRAPGHAGRWAECLADPWLEWPAVRRT